MGKKLTQCLGMHALTLATLSGVIFGVVVGLIVRASSKSPWTQREVMYVHFIGDLFLRMLIALVLPLIISALIAAIGSLDIRMSGRIGARTIVYYMTTLYIAVTIGIVLVMTIQPGADRHFSGESDNETPAPVNIRQTTTADTLLDLIRNMFPPNLIQACAAQYQTILIKPETFENGTGMMI